MADPADRADADLAPFRAMIPRENGLCVLSTLRADGSVQSTVVNAGVLDHPVTGAPVAGLVAVGGSLKLRHLRADPRATLTCRVGWQWATVEGEAEVVGPDDPHPAVDPEGLRLLLRDVFTAAGGVHEDWDTYDAVMARERRAAVLVSPRRVYGTPG